VDRYGKIKSIRQLSMQCPHIKFHQNSLNRLELKHADRHDSVYEFDLCIGEREEEEDRGGRCMATYNTFLCFALKLGLI